MEFNNFFYFDSDHLDNVASQLYGYALCQEDELDFDTIADCHDKLKDGAFVLVQNAGKKIYVVQDTIGSYGIYLYKNEQNNFFAISNSWLMLAEKIQGRFKLTLNRDYLMHFFLADLVPLAYEETVFNEIKMLPRNSRVIIDKEEKKYCIENIPLEDEIIDLDSTQGIQILDRWFFKWSAFIKNLVDTGKCVHTDLTGGFDSRLVFSLFLSSGVNLDRVMIRSNDNSLHTYGEDFEIASEIAEYFKFKLNVGPLPRKEKIGVEQSIKSSWYGKLGVHKQLGIPPSLYTEEFFHLGGIGGEALRAYWGDLDVQEFVKQYINRQRRSGLDDDYLLSLKNILQRTLTQIKMMYRYPSEDGYLMSLLYKETRIRYHYGRDMVTHAAMNSVRFAPLLDSTLQMLKKDIEDQNLFVAVILDRYCPDLLKFKFEGGRCINPETIIRAKSINQKYPLTKITNIKRVNVIKNTPNIVSKNKLNNIRAEDFIKRMFLSREVKNTFGKYFPMEFYRYALAYSQDKKFQPISEINAVITAVKCIDLQDKGNNISFEQRISNLTYDEYLSDKIQDVSTLIGVERLVKILQTARIDINYIHGQLEGSLSIEPIKSDTIAYISSPAWFKKENSTGYVIESKGKSLILKIGNLRAGTKLIIGLKSTDVRDKEGNRILVDVDYSLFSIAGNSIIRDEVVCTTHDRPFKYEYEVIQDEEILLEISWEMHDKNRNELVEYLNKLL